MVDFPPRRKPSRKGTIPTGSLEMLAHREITGSMADVPKDLLDQIKELERIFSVDQAKLKEVTDHFVKELEKGKSSGASILRYHLIRLQVSR